MGAAGIRGADLELLDGLEAALKRQAGTLRTVGNQATAGATTLERLWQGPDSAHFRQIWTSTHRVRLNRAVEELLDAAATLQRNRQAQNLTSTADGRSEGPGRSGGPGLSGPGGPGPETPVVDLPDPELAGDKIDRPFWFDGFEHDDLEYQRLADDEFGLLGPDGSGSPELSDINQGQIGDCWFLAGLGAAVHNDPDLIADNVRDNGDGTYTVTLYERDGDGYEPVEVIVDDSVPVDENGNPHYAQPSGDGETWAMVYEKAYAQHVGGYDEIEGGSAQVSLEVITGQAIERQNPVDLSDTELVDALQDGPAAIGMINPDPDSSDADDVAAIQNFDNLDLFHSHQYVVEDVFEQDGEWHVQLYNPHGPTGLQPGAITLDEFRSVSDELNTPQSS